MKILVINAGSSSIKYQLFHMPEAEVLAKGHVERIGEAGSKLVHTSDAHPKQIHETPVEDHQRAVELILDALVAPDTGVIADIAEIAAVGHRVVHGGEKFTGSVVIDDEVIASIEEFADLAPLHNPANLTAIRAAQSKLPRVPQVACFDTAFHTTIPRTAYTYALPYEFYEKYRIRRYGFHGTSHRYVARRAAELLGKGKYDVNLITCHLGNGCSITAVKNGRSVDTSMGMTPLEGLVMGTRTGDFDPAIIFYLNRKGHDVDELKTICNKSSGLLGLSGESNDMRTLTELAASGHERAQLALDIFAYRVKKYIGAYTAALGTLDAVVFTGGIGENAVEMRAAICADLGQIGIELDETINAQVTGDEADIAADTSAVRILVIPTDEEQAIAKDTFKLVGANEPLTTKQELPLPKKTGAPPSL